MSEISHIDIEAAEWALRIEKGALSQDEMRELHAWQNQSDEHLAAYIRARGFSLYLAEIRQTTAVRRPAFSRRQLLAASVSGLALLGGAAWLTAQLGGARTYTTATGAQQRQILADASELLLNTASEARVSYGSVRSVDLVRGELLINALPAARPFIVHVLHWALLTFGAVFSVRMDSPHVQVSVEDGDLSVQETTSGHVLRRLDPGKQLVLGPYALPPAHPLSTSDLSRLRSLRRGILVFNNTPLWEAVAEINRYRTRKLRLEAREAQGQTLSGSWPIAESQRMVADVERRFRLRAIPQGSELVLTPAP